MYKSVMSGITGFAGECASDVGGQQMRRDGRQGTDGQGGRRTGQAVVFPFHGDVRQDKLQRQRTFPSTYTIHTIHVH